MKFWKICLIMIVLSVGWVFCTDAAELPLEIHAEYAQDQQEMLVSVSLKEPAVLNAFTFSVVYNMDVYKLYKGNDCVENGYGYTPVFQAQYQKDGGMAVCNADENQVLFSGAGQSAHESVSQGQIARVSLLKYRPDAVVDFDSDVRLVIHTLYLNGQMVDLQPDEQQVPCEVQPVEQIVYQEEAAGSDIQQDLEDTEDAVSEPDHETEPSAHPLEKADTETAGKKETIQEIQEEVSAEPDGRASETVPASGDAAAADSKVSDGPQEKADDSDNQSLWGIAVPLVCLTGITGIIIYVKIRQKRK